MNFSGELIAELVNTSDIGRALIADALFNYALSSNNALGSAHGSVLAASASVSDSIFGRANVADISTGSARIS